MSPKRIQRQRVKGWRMPEGAVYVGRPTKWGNPYRAGKLLILTGKKAGQRADAADVVSMYQNLLSFRNDRAAEVRQMVRDELRGKDLCCWCAPTAPCHADVLLDIANAAEVSDGQE